MDERAAKRIRLLPRTLNVPPEIISLIFHYAGGSFVIRIGCNVCKDWANCANEESLWEELFVQQFPWKCTSGSKMEEFISIFYSAFRKRTEIIKEAVSEFVDHKFAKELLTRKWIKDPRLVFYTKLRLYGYKVNDEAEIPVGFSRIGGKPDLPKNYIPNLPDDYLFFFQINLNHANFYVHETELLPPRGMLYVFIPTVYDKHERYNWIIYLSPDEIKHHGELVEKTQYEAKADTKLYKIDFAVEYGFPSRIELEQLFGDLNDDELNVLAALGNYISLKDPYRSFPKDCDTDLSLFGYETPDCIDIADQHFLFDDDYFLRSSFSNLKIIPLSELLDDDETSLSGQILLERFTVRYPNDKSDIICKQMFENFQSDREKQDTQFITIEKNNLRVSYTAHTKGSRRPMEHIYFLLVQPDQEISVPNKEQCENGFKEQYLLMTTSQTLEGLQNCKLNQQIVPNRDEIARCVDPSWKRDMITLINDFSSEDVYLGMHDWTVCFGCRKGDLINNDLGHVKIYYDDYN
jgi:hypothetical protein